MFCAISPCTSAMSQTTSSAKPKPEAASSLQRRRAPWLRATTATYARNLSPKKRAIVGHQGLTTFSASGLYGLVGLDPETSVLRQPWKGGSDCRRPLGHTRQRAHCESGCLHVSGSKVGVTIFYGCAPPDVMELRIQGPLAGWGFAAGGYALTVMVPNNPITASITVALARSSRWHLGAWGFQLGLLRPCSTAAAGPPAMPPGDRPGSS